MVTRRNERHVLVVLLNGTLVGSIHQSTDGKVRFAYADSWREADDAYPLSLSMPLAAVDHRHDVLNAYLWGLLPDNELTLDRYGRLFGVSSRNPVSLLRHMGADCAGAVQFLPPDTDDRSRGATKGGTVVWLDEREVARELMNVRTQGIPGTSSGSAGQFSLAGAQPKIALIEEDGRWGRPSGRIPTTRILKPPTGEFRGFAENEHFCLELAAGLDLAAVRSRVMKFENEIAIVVDRFDRIHQRNNYIRVHQEDVCQALGVMPTHKYENEGGPGITAIITLLRDYSSNPSEDIERFIWATVLNWVIAATDAHAKNYSLLHGPGGGVRLAPFYDILSYLPYADPELHKVKLAMKIAGKYEITRINKQSWQTLETTNDLSRGLVLRSVGAVLERLPAIVDSVANQAIVDGLEAQIIETLRARVLERTRASAALLAL